MTVKKIDKTVQDFIADWIELAPDGKTIVVNARNQPIGYGTSREIMEAFTRDLEMQFIMQQRNLTENLLDEATQAVAMLKVAKL